VFTITNTMNQSFSKTRFDCRSTRPAFIGDNHRPRRRSWSTYLASEDGLRGKYSQGSVTAGSATGIMIDVELYPGTAQYSHKSIREARAYTNVVPGPSAVQLPGNAILHVSSSIHELCSHPSHRQQLKSQARRPYLLQLRPRLWPNQKLKQRCLLQVTRKQ